MTIRSLVALAVVAACGKSSPPSTDKAAPTPAPPPAPAVAAPVAAATAPPCPEGDALTAKLGTLWKLTTDSISNASCVAGKFPAPGWYVSAYVAVDGSTFDRSAVVDASGAIVSSSEEDIPPGLVDSSGTQNFRAVDFDRDGTDELVYTFSSDRRGFVEEHLFVAKLAKGKWEMALSRGYSYDSSAAVENESEAETCEATWEIDANLAVTFTPTGKAHSTSTENCVLAKETWTLGADGKFAKVATPKKS